MPPTRERAFIYNYFWSNSRSLLFRCLLLRFPHTLIEISVHAEFLLEGLFVKLCQGEEVLHELLHQLMEPFLYMILNTLKGLELVAEFITVERGYHEEFLFKFPDIQRLHL